MDGWVLGTGRVLMPAADRGKGRPADKSHCTLHNTFDFALCQHTFVCYMLHVHIIILEVRTHFGPLTLKK